MSVGSGSMISVPAHLDKYGIRARSHADAGISIRVIHEYLDIHGYLWVPIDFLINFFVQRKIFFNYLQTSTFKYPYITCSILISLSKQIHLT